MAVNDIQNAVINSGNSTTKLTNKLIEFNTRIIYGKTNTPPLINFSNEGEKKKFLQDIKTYLSDPSLANTVFLLRLLNSYDLCNPFMFITNTIGRALPGVAGTFTEIQGKINEIVSKFENFSIVDSFREAKATARTSLSNASTAELAFGGGSSLASSNLVGIPFQEGKIFLNIQTADVLTNGASITITQLEDNKINSSMIGQIEQVIPLANGTKNVSINVNSIFPSIPPTGEDGETPKIFTNFSVEFETKTSTNINDLARDLQDLINELRSIGIQDIASSLENLPEGLPGVSKIKPLLTQIIEIIGEAQNTRAFDAVDTAGNVLAGNISAVEVIRRVRIFRDFYNKIRPYTNLNFAIQSFFSDEIEGINRFLKGFIPYEEMAKFIKWITLQAKNILQGINYVIGILKIVSTAIKIITIILKVIKIIVKVLKKVIKAIPSITTTVGVQEVSINGVGGLENGINQAIILLKSISLEIDSVIRQLQLTKFYLEQFIREGAQLQATLESCNGIQGSGLDTIMNQANRNNFNALRTLLNSVPVLNTNTRFGSNGTGTNNNNTPGTFVVTEGGTIILLTDSVFGYDEQGNIVFYGDLVSLSTGVNFEDTLGQDFRSRLQYYTFNKFKNLDSAGNLIQKAEKLFLAKQTRIADPEDIFGNFQELYLGYTLKIQEEKRIDPNVQILVRRRGIALDSNGKIIASTELTFATDLSGIVQELKIKLNQFVQQGIIGVNTLDTQPNEISDEDAINLAETYGTSPIGINNLKANNADNNITNVVSGVNNNIPEDVETRIGNEPFSSPTSNNINTTVQGVPINTPNNAEMQVTGNNSPTVNKKIDVQKLTTNSLNQFINENPSLKNISDTFSTLSKISPAQLSAVLSQPGAENISEEELIANLKNQILSEIDPNPEKVGEIRELTTRFLDALEGVIRAEWEAATRNTPIKYRIPFETYYERVEKDKIQEFIQSLLRKDYTETEVQLGVSKEEIGDKYSIKIDGTKVTVKLRNRK
jgi:hypothetical protein